MYIYFVNVTALFRTLVTRFGSRCRHTVTLEVADANILR